MLTGPVRAGLDERPHEVDIAAHGPGRQPSLDDQIPAIPVKQLLRHRQRHLLSRGRHPKLAKVAQQRRHPHGKPAQTRVPNNVLPPEPLHLRLTQIRRPESLPRQPLAQMRQQPQLDRCRRRPVPGLLKHGDEPRGKRLKRPGHPDPRRLFHEDAPLDRGEASVA